MKTIRNHSDVQAVFPEYFSCETPQSLVLSRYTLFQKVSTDNIILFSFVTDSILMLSQKEYQAIITMNFDGQENFFETLSKNGFFVNKNTNEYSLMIRQRNAIFTRVPKTLKVVILPTTACNARCSYCIGMNNSIVSMTYDTAKKSINYIIERAKKYENIKLDWYGGEPLLKHELITFICDEIHRRMPDINYASVVTSNLVCFNDKILNQAIQSWHIQKVNVTIDGSEREHNIRKNYLQHEFNGYKHTLNCIRSILDKHIKVFCRYNIDRNNVYQLSSVLGELKPFFADNDFYFFISPLRGENRHEEFYQITEYNDIFYRTGVILNEFGVKNAIDSFVPKCQDGFCLAKSEHSIVIGPDGSLYRCNLDDLIKENTTGSVYMGLKKNKIYHQFLRLDLDEFCKECVFLPICQGGCPVQAKNASKSNCQCDKFKYKVEAISRLLAKYYI